MMTNRESFTLDKQDDILQPRGSSRLNATKSKRYLRGKIRLAEIERSMYIKVTYYLNTYLLRNICQRAEKVLMEQNSSISLYYTYVHIF